MLRSHVQEGNRGPIKAGLGDLHVFKANHPDEFLTVDSLVLEQALESGLESLKKAASRLPKKMTPSRLSPPLAGGRWERLPRHQN